MHVLLDRSMRQQPVDEVTNRVEHFRMGIPSYKYTALFRCCYYNFVHQLCTDQNSLPHCLQSMHYSVSVHSVGGCLGIIALCLQFSKKSFFFLPPYGVLQELLQMKILLSCTKKEKKNIRQEMTYILQVCIDANDECLGVCTV